VYALRHVLAAAKQEPLIRQAGAVMSNVTGNISAMPAISPGVMLNIWRANRSMANDAMRTAVSKTSNRQSVLRSGVFLYIRGKRALPAAVLISQMARVVPAVSSFPWKSAMTSREMII